MKLLNRRILLSTLSFAAMTVAGVSMAQDAVRPMPSDLGGRCNCSHPVNIKIQKNSNPTPDTKDFPAGFLKSPAAPYMFAGTNYHFGDTIKWTVPTKTCEVKGTISWTVTNLGADGLQTNDSSSLSANGASIPGMGGSIGSLPKGGTKTFSYPMTAAIWKSGQISVSLQDDTAMKDFKVEVTGCCIDPM